MNNQSRNTFNIAPVTLQIIEYVGLPSARIKLLLGSSKELERQSYGCNAEIGHSQGKYILRGTTKKKNLFFQNKYNTEN